MMRKLLDLDARYTDSLRIAEKPGFLRSLAVFFAHSGDSWFWLLGLGLIWWFGSEPWKRLSERLVFTIAVTAVLVMVVKFTVRRRRPTGDWGEIYRKTDPHSFPSGHAARAAMLAVVCLGLGPLWFGLLLLAWAPLVTLARVAMGVHYLSDVLVGMLFGTVIGLVMLSVIPRLAFLS
jgi:undecaprenyl-diphosphatase